MTVLRTILLLLGSFISASHALGQDRPAVDLNDPASLREANRVLEEELKLAGKAQPYLILDLVDQVMLIKARGVELHRIPVLDWRVCDAEALAGVFSLQARPPVMRRKIAPANADQEPISLKDMPSYYRIRFEPSLIVVVLPSAEAGTWRWLAARGQDWWARLHAWGATFWDRKAGAPAAGVHLTLAPDQAQSLAWSLTDGIPLIVHRPSPQR